MHCPPPQGLTSLVREGSPLHSPVLGSLAGVALEARRAWLNAGYFARGAPLLFCGMWCCLLCSWNVMQMLWAEGLQLRWLQLPPQLQLHLHHLVQLTWCGFTSPSRSSSSNAATPGGGSAWSVLAQAVLAPTTSLSAGMTYLHHSSAAAASSAAADPAAAAAADGGSGPAMVGALERVAAPFGAPAAQRQLGSTLAWRLGEEAVLHGWAAADADEVEHSVRDGRLAAVRPQQWGLLLGSFPDGSGNGWAVGAGHSAAASGAAAGAGAAANRLLPNLYELSLQFNLGDGLTLTPGMVVLAPRGGRTTALLGVRTAWSF